VRARLESAYEKGLGASPPKLEVVEADDASAEQLKQLRDLGYLTETD